jgi:hypothetical protein
MIGLLYFSAYTVIHPSDNVSHHADPKDPWDFERVRSRKKVSTTRGNLSAVFVARHEVRLCDQTSYHHTRESICPRIHIYVPAEVCCFDQIHPMRERHSDQRRRPCHGYQNCSLYSSRRTQLRIEGLYLRLPQYPRIHIARFRRYLRRDQCLGWSDDATSYQAISMPLIVRLSKGIDCDSK